jgi:spore coat polysaccharide biosynthesis predicted glycosyltransferase SpsG
VGDALNDLLLSYDDGPEVGLGHRRRMEALAAAFERRGVVPTIGPCAPPLRADVVVLDSYMFRADDATVVDAGWVGAVDDISRNLAVDLVVDPAPGADPAAHTSSRAVLAGAKYSLVGAGLPAPPPLRPMVEAVVVTLGASQQARAAGDLARRIAQALPRATVRVVASPWSDISVPAGVDAIQTVDGLGPHLATADIVVTAAGVTMLESLALGRPTIAVVLADNQTRAAHGAVAASAIHLVDIEDAVAAIVALADDAVERQRLSDAARALIDGHGPDRAANEILARIG